MEVKRGYKHTEAGMIPEEWRIETFGDIFTISGGFSASRDQLSQNGYCYLHYGDIHKSTKTFIDVRAEFVNIPKLDISLKRVSPKSLLNDGDVVFVDASEDDEGASKHIVVVNKESIPYISGLHTIVVKSKTMSVDDEYKRYCFQTRDIKRQFYYYAVGTKVTGISKSNIAKILVPLPPPAEQHAIATALSDVDALINSLDHLIAKKRDLKQATMQELLTGKRRLPGFEGEWEVKKIGELLEYERPDRYIVRSTDYQGNAKIPVLTANKSFVLGYTNEEFGVHRNSPVIIFDDFTTDSKYVDFPFKVKSSAIKILRSKAASTDLKFVHERMQIIHFPIGEHKRYYISEYQHIGIPTPKPEEQAAIATVLSDMDAEIVALEQKCDKTIALKQGMMQELLTGRIRLV